MNEQQRRNQGPAAATASTSTMVDRRQGFGRRAFLQAMAAVSGGALVAPHLPLGGRTASARAQEGEPRQGGTWRLLTDEGIPTLDTLLAFNYISWWLNVRVLYNRLYVFDQEGQLQPDIADGMPEVSDDGLVYTFKLKPGVLFHNGRELTAEDVKFSFDRGVWPELESPASATFDNVAGWEEIATAEVDPNAPPDTSRGMSGIEVVDPLTLRITMLEPRPLLPALLTDAVHGIVPKQETIDAGKDFGTAVIIGTGPFKLGEWALNERLSLVRHDGYFHEGRPYLDGLEVTFNVDPQTQTLRWEAGEAESAPSIPGPELARIRADPVLSTRLKEGPSLTWYYMDISNNVPLFQDLKVRQALAHAIDKENLVRLAQDGVVTDTWVLPGMPEESDFASNYAYDPDRARQLLAEAGIAEGTQTILWSGGTAPALGESIQADFRAIGLEPELLILEGSSFDVFKDRIDAGEIPLRTWGNSPSFPDGSQFPLYALTCGPSPFPTSWCDPEIAELTARMEQLPLGDPERNDLVHQAEEIAINEKVYIVPLYSRGGIVFSQDWVHGDEPDLILTQPVIENVWMDER